MEKKNRSVTRATVFLLGTIKRILRSDMQVMERPFDRIASIGDSSDRLGQRALGGAYGRLRTVKP